MDSKPQAGQAHEVCGDVANLPKSRWQTALGAIFPCFKSKAQLAAASSREQAHPPSEYASSRIQGMMEGMEKFRSVSEAEIEASRDHWSEFSSEPVSSEEEVAKVNVEIFRSLQEKWGKEFFYELDNRWVLSEEPFAEGAQAQLFHAHYTLEGSEKRRNHELCYTAKVFKHGTALRNLQQQWPHGMLQRSMHQDSKFLSCDDGPRNGEQVKNSLRRAKSGQRYCEDRSGLHAGVMLPDGRFAFIMYTYWGDLRKLIDIRMQYKSRNEAPPLTQSEVIDIMMQIAVGMRGLHKDKIIHRDLKASNVLVRWPQDRRNQWYFHPLLDYKLEYHVADYETSIGMVGTGFWRAPEILLHLKTRDAKFSEQSDVYSYGMTCYEILTGRIPFEGMCNSDYDVVLRGERPTMPSDIEPWMKALVSRCWHQDPAKRPTFQKIVKTLKPFARLPFVETINSKSDMDRIRDYGSTVIDNRPGLVCAGTSSYPRCRRDPEDCDGKTGWEDIERRPQFISRLSMQ